MPACVRYRADKPSPFFYIFSMPRYDFNIRQGEKANSRGQQLDFPDDRSAWREAALFCRDYSRDIVSEFETHPEWQLEVTDEAGKALFRFRFVAETL